MKDLRFRYFLLLLKNQKGRHEKLIENIKMQGFVRARIDGEVYDLSEETIDLNKTRNIP